MKKGFTNLKDVDSLILQKLTYSELEKACEYDTFTQNICNTDNFWRSHLLKHYRVDGETSKFMMIFWGFKSLKDLDKYLFDYGDNVQRVIAMYNNVSKSGNSNFIDIIISNSLNDRFFVKEGHSDFAIFIGISQQMRRTIPQLILTKTNSYLIFFFSDVRTAFGEFFITIEEGNEWTYIEPYFVKKEDLEWYGGPIHARKQDVAPGEDYVSKFLNHIKLAEKTQRIWERYATSKWPKFLG